MKHLFIIALLAAGLAAPSVLWAQSAEARLLERLRSEGYELVEMRRTFLGRLRIIAEGPAGAREIVINPATGAILRDYFEEAEEAERVLTRRAGDEDEGEDQDADDHEEEDEEDDADSDDEADEDEDNDDEEDD